MVCRVLKDGGGIVYKAAAEMKTSDDEKKHKLDKMVIPRGNYITETVHNFMDDAPLVEKTFEKLLKQPSLDPQGYCVELYSPNEKDVICMILLKA